MREGETVALDSFKLQYDAGFIGALRATVAAAPENTPDFIFAKAKLHAANNDLSGARACLERGLTRHANPDQLNWEDFFRAALVCRQMDMGEVLLDHRFASRPRFKLRLGDESTRNWPINAFQCTIGQNECAITLHLSLYDNPHVEFLIKRLQHMLVLLSQYTRCHLETGSVILNVGDDGSRPGLAYCENRKNYFLVPDEYFLQSQGYAELREHLVKNPLPWSSRKPIAFWRGSTTGESLSPELGWRGLPRIKLCEMAQSDKSGLFDVGISEIELAPDSPWREEIRASGLMRPYVPPRDFYHYKYQIDIDGHTNSWPGLFQKLLTGSTVLKLASQRNFRQWYYDRLKPWINFVPVAADGLDLADKVEWLIAHDDAARKIGANGREFALGMTCEAEIQRSGRIIHAALCHFQDKPEIDLCFGKTGEAEGVLLGDWPDPLEDGIPSEGFESRLAFLRPASHEDYILSLEISLPDGITAPQRLTVAVNGWLALERTIAARTWLISKLPYNRLKMHDVLSVTLLHPDAAQAASQGNPLDARLASVILHRLLLTSADAHANDPVPPARNHQAGSHKHIAPRAAAKPVDQKFRILTHHETLVFLDGVTNQLRHGPAKSSPKNIFVVVQDGIANMFRETEEGFIEPASISPSTPSSSSNLNATTSFEAVPSPGDSFGLLHQGLYLCAEAEGDITLSRTQLGPWELFRPLQPG
jgi:hypothetical protein